ncbi:hypothetical protein BD324DRAFT_303474 [Kockovaella imperatae]|uniref:Uncharacterized protein n=1 Tax=Kockovaella imperatae TaxID=4999 RepID=A0A1Y1ULX2_9TREE|nr:hypothetical protein BD324DRAFT_303474 [Kockovaella imperatae]ORX38999.1 hypothetical protein BD324DRAFT_303474 [Kockovaella imperatae]
MSTFLKFTGRRGWLVSNESRPGTSLEQEASILQRRNVDFGLLTVNIIVPTSFIPCTVPGRDVSQLSCLRPPYPNPHLTRICRAEHEQESREKGGRRKTPLASLSIARRFVGRPLERHTASLWSPIERTPGGAPLKAAGPVARKKNFKANVKMDSIDHPEESGSTRLTNLLRRQFGCAPHPGEAKNATTPPLVPCSRDPPRRSLRLVCVMFGGDERMDNDPPPREARKLTRVQPTLRWMLLPYIYRFGYSS